MEHETLSASDEVTRQVVRGITEARIAVLLVLVALSIGVGVTAGFEENSVVIGVGCGLVAFFVVMGLLALVYRWGWLRHKAMALMHLVTGK